MIKVNGPRVKLRGGRDIVAELGCAIVAVLEFLYMNDDIENIEKVLKPTLKEFLKCKSYKDLQEKYLD